MTVLNSYPVQDVGCNQFGGNTTGKIFKALATETALNTSIVSMSLGIAFFQQWQPGLLGMLALGKVKRSTVGLINGAIGVLWVVALQLVEEHTIDIVVVVVSLGQIKLHESLATNVSTCK